MKLSQIHTKIHEKRRESNDGIPPNCPKIRITFILISLLVFFFPSKQTDTIKKINPRKKKAIEENRISKSSQFFMGPTEINRTC